MGWKHSTKQFNVTSPVTSFCPYKPWDKDHIVDQPAMDSKMVIHKGGCHCKRVRWEVEAAASVTAWECNCSDCYMRGNTHFTVPAARFKLLGDSDNFVSTYTFGTHIANHTFCKVCGITSFYHSRSTPDGVSVTFRCVHPGTLAHVEIKKFDGKNWEAARRPQRSWTCCGRGSTYTSESTGRVF